jgi:hypothetical protein
MRQNMCDVVGYREREGLLRIEGASGVRRGSDPAFAAPRATHV